MIREMCKEVNVPQDSEEVFAAAWEAVQSNETAKREFELAKECFFRNMEAARLHLQAVSDATGIVIHTVHYLLGLVLVPVFKKNCETLGVPEEIYRDSLSDLRSKIFECRGRYGVDGTFVLFWYQWLFTCKVLKIGRLMYEPDKWGFEQYSPILQKGTPTFRVHILSYEPFTPDLVTDSLKKAYAFYHIGETADKMMKIECSSWLLYPPTRTLYKKGGNLDKFADLFDVIACRESKTGLGWGWRVFGLQPTAETLADMPEDTSMRRAFKRYLLAGGKMGTGHGVFFFDGERILTKEEAQRATTV